MFSRDEMQRAIEDALKSMEGVALELYRRGREEAREELETVKRERTSCPDCAMWAERSVRWHDDMQRAERERDEAREERDNLLDTRSEGAWMARALDAERMAAEAEKLSDAAKAAWDAECIMREQRDRFHAEWKQERQEVERLRVELIRAGSRECDIAACNCGTWHHQSPRAAYRRGAEAMREACARWMSEREGISQWVYDDALSALPIPEEP